MLTYTQATAVRDKLMEFVKGQTPGTTMTGDEVAKFIYDEFEKELSMARVRTDFKKVNNTHLISNQEQNVSEAQVRQKVNLSLKKISKDQALEKDMVLSVKKLPRGQGQKSDLYKVNLRPERFEDSNSKWVYPAQKLIAGIALFNKDNPTKRMFSQAFAPTAVKQQAIKLNELASRIRAKNAKNKWQTRTVVNFKNLKMELKVRAPGKKSNPWTELSNSNANALDTFKPEYAAIQALPYTPYEPKPQAPESVNSTSTTNSNNTSSQSSAPPTQSQQNASGSTAGQGTAPAVSMPGSAPSTSAGIGQGMSSSAPQQKDNSYN